MRTPVLTAGVGIASLLVGACARSEAAFDPCPFDVVRAEVYNTYADHEPADLQVLEGDDAEFVCDYAFPYESALLRDYDDEKLGDRRITVFTFTGADGASRTTWVYGIAGHDAGTAIVFDTGESFHIPNEGPAPYYAAEAEVVDRAEVPVR